MAVLFVVYMPNEEREENDEDVEPFSPAPLMMSKHATVNGNSKIPYNDDNDNGGGGEKADAVPNITIEIGDDGDEFSLNKPLLDTGDEISSESSDKPADDNDNCVTKHQSLLRLNKSIPRRSSDNVLTNQAENMQSSDIKATSESVVYKGNKVRFEVTKLDTPDSQRTKQPASEAQHAAEAAASMDELVTETKGDEKKTSLVTDEEADVELERLTLKEVNSFIQLYVQC